MVCGSLLFILFTWLVEMLTVFDQMESLLGLLGLGMFQFRKLILGWVAFCCWVRVQIGPL